MNGNQYHSTIKVEFKDLIGQFLSSERKSFHLYTIHRLLSLGLLIDFKFKYTSIESPENSVGIEMDLGEFGKTIFIVDLDKNYGYIKDEECKENLRSLFYGFDTKCEGVKRNVF